MTVFFLLTPLNLVLGFLAAMWMRRAISQRAGLLEQALDEQEDAAEGDEQDGNLDGELPEDEDVAGSDEIPEAWMELLYEEAIAPETLLEGAIHFLRLRARQHLEEVFEINLHLAEFNTEEDAPQAAQIPNSVLDLAGKWLESIESMQQLLESSRDRFGRGTDVFVMLDSALTGQCDEAATVRSRMEEVNFGREFMEERATAAEIIRTHIDSVVSLCEYLDELFAALVIAEKRLESVEQALLFDSDTGLLNYCGLEQALDTCRKPNPEGHSGILIGIDDFNQLAHFKERYIGDRVAESVAQVLEANVRKGRGFDRLSRLGQGRFFLLLGDTEARLAGIPAERIRKVMESATFRCGRSNIQLTVRCTCCEIRKEDQLEDTIRRLEKGISQSAATEANRALLYQAGKYVEVDELDMPVREMQVEINERELALN